MAVRLEAWIGSQSQVGTGQPASKSSVLSLEERRARLQRRRRRSRAHAALEGAIWLAGSGVVVMLALSGVFGLR
jgi:fatty acid desaturase